MSSSIGPHGRKRPAPRLSPAGVRPHRRVVTLGLVSPRAGRHPRHLVPSDFHSPPPAPGEPWSRRPPPAPPPRPPSLRPRERQEREGSLSFKGKERREPAVYTAGFLSCRAARGTNHALKIADGRRTFTAHSQHVGRKPSGRFMVLVQNMVLWFSQVTFQCH